MFFEPPRESFEEKFSGLKDRVVRKIEDKIEFSAPLMARKQLSVRITGMFEKSRVREIGIPLCIYDTNTSLVLKQGQNDCIK